METRERKNSESRICPLESSFKEWKHQLVDQHNVIYELLNLPLRNGNYVAGRCTSAHARPLESSFKEWKHSRRRLVETLAVHPLESSFKEWKQGMEADVVYSGDALESSFKEWKHAPPRDKGAEALPLESSFKEWKQKKVFELRRMPVGLLNLPLRNGNHHPPPFVHVLRLLLNLPLRNGNSQVVASCVQPCHS